MMINLFYQVTSRTNGSVKKVSSRQGSTELLVVILVDITGTPRAPRATESIEWCSLLKEYVAQWESLNLSEP